MLAKARTAERSWVTKQDRSFPHPGMCEPAEALLLEPGVADGQRASSMISTSGST